jgi:hypothetical protein
MVTKSVRGFFEKLALLKNKNKREAVFVVNKNSSSSILIKFYFANGAEEIQRIYVASSKSEDVEHFQAF